MPRLRVTGGSRSRDIAEVKRLLAHARRVLANPSHAAQMSCRPASLDVREGHQRRRPSLVIWASAMLARGSLPRGAATRSVCRHDLVASCGIVKKAAAASASDLIVQRLAILRGRIGTGG